MSTYRAGKAYSFQCDTCSRPTERYEGDFKTALAAAKLDGWRAYMDKVGAWCHACPACASDQNLMDAIRRGGQ